MHEVGGGHSRWVRAGRSIICLVMFLALGAGTMGSIGIINALATGQQDRLVKDALGAGTFGAMVGLLMSIGLMIAIDERFSVRQILLVGLGTFVLTVLAAGGVFSSVWQLSPTAAPYAAGVAAFVAIPASFAGVMLVQPR